MSLKTWRGLTYGTVTNGQIAAALDMTPGAARRVISGGGRVGSQAEKEKTLLKILTQPASAREYLQGIADGREPERLAEIEAKARSESPSENKEASNQVDACQQPKSTKPYALSSLPQTVSLQETDTHPDYSESGDLCLVRVAVDTEEFFENRYLKGTILSVDRQDLLGLHHHDPRLLNIFKHIKKPTHNQIAAARSDLGLPDPEGMRPFHLDFQEHTLNRISTYTPPEETIDEYKARTSHLPKLEMIDPDTISENFERYKSQRDGYCKQRTDETITERNQLREETHRILGAL